MMAWMTEFLRRIDWRIVLMLGPRHKFSDAQWARLAHLAEVSPSVKLAGLVNAVVLSYVLTLHLPAALAGWAGLGFFALSLAILGVGTAVWRRPTMQRLYMAYLVTSFPLGLFVGFVIVSLRGRPEFAAVGEALMLRGVMLGMAGAFATWAIAMWRNEFLADWLHDEALREQSAELTRRLSSAQIQPHFLFNSLASLQHWVATKDDRAAPLLESLTGYLRATLPLFDRERLAVGDEAEAVRRYLEVMQARLGTRLRFAIAVEPAAAALQLPPGVLLTLVENAVEHGVQPQLSGGEVRLTARVDADGALVIDIADDGPGLTEPQELRHGAAASLGLANTRLRLAQAFGQRARLTLANRDCGGCLASVVVAPEKKEENP